MRKLLATAAALGLLSVSLVACSTTAAPTCDRSVSPGALDSLVTVSGSGDTAPDVTVSVPFNATGTTYTDTLTGTGTAIVSGQQLFAIGLTIVDGDTGDVLVQQGYDDLTGVGTIDTWASVIPAFEDALMCATAGSQVVIGLDSDGLSDAAATQIGLDEGASAVAVVDLRKVYLSAADGADVYNDQRGLPTVVLAPGGRPGIIIPDATAPTETVVEVLKRGDGATLELNDAARVNFTTASWANRTEISSSWDSSPETVTLGDASNELIAALIGQTVGSQVMVVLPSTEDDGDATVYVIDILGIDGAAE